MTIINTSFVTGVFPNAWKHASVIPLFKKGDKANVNNYRPISLLPILSKIAEKIVSQQLLHFLSHNNSFSRTQHGFRPKLCTESALQVITDKIYSNMDNKKISLLTVCDLSKAFDSVSHNILQRKCEQLNIDTHWLKSYLTDRSQSVKIDNVISSTQHVRFGVPQGSILGPILFNIYVNDMSSFISDCTLVQYADDTQFLHQNYLSQLSDLDSRTESTLIMLKNYFQANGLLVNPTKTQCIFIGNVSLCSKIPEDIIIRFDDICIKPSKHIKNLGLIMDQCLNFEMHINEINKKVIGALIYINRLSSFFNKSTRRLMIDTLVLSQANYCLRIWGTTNTTVLNKVQKVQNFPAKVAVGGLRKHDHVSPTFQELKWLRINKKYTYDVCITMHKFIYGFYPDFIHKFLSVRDVTPSGTRQQNNLVVPRTRTNAGAKGFTAAGPKVWNSLPQDIKDTSSFISFKRKVLNYLLSDVC